MACKKCTRDGVRIKKPKITFLRGIVNPRKVETPDDRKAKKS